MNILCDLGGHIWTDWSQPFAKHFQIVGGLWSKKNGEVIGNGIENWQRRTCTKCQLAQDRKVHEQQT